MSEVLTSQLKLQCVGHPEKNKYSVTDICLFVKYSSKPYCFFLHVTSSTTGNYCTRMDHVCLVAHLHCTVAYCSTNEVMHRNGLRDLAECLRIA
jgi:hypothetical protein